MLSRVAEAIYWTGRYIERAENTARFIDVNLAMTLDAPVAFSDQWEPLVAITGAKERFAERYDAPTAQNVIYFLALDPLHGSSILSCLQKARENARSVRDALSSEMWEQINRVYLFVTQAASHDRALVNPSAFLNEVKLQSHLVAGTADNTMSHGEAWHFFQLGRLIERSDNTSRLLDVKYFLLLPSTQDVGGPVDEMQWSIVLRSASALEMYRKRYGPLSPPRIVEFLLLDYEFPRAILFCLTHADASLRFISSPGPGMPEDDAREQLSLLRGELAEADVAEIITSGLHEFLESFQIRLTALGVAIERTFFALESAHG